MGCDLTPNSATTCSYHVPEPIVPSTPDEAVRQVREFMALHRLPGDFDPLDDEKMEYHEVVVVVRTAEELERWIAPTQSFQITHLAGVHEHGSAPGITDAIRYVVARNNGAENLIGGGDPDALSPITPGWSLWIRHYPQSRTIFSKPLADQDIFPGRTNSFLIPLRPGLKPQTGSTIPHQQLTQLSPEPVRLALKEWLATAFPHVTTGPSLVSDHTTWSLHLDSAHVSPGARLLAPMPGAGEFAHLHADGSMHMSLNAEDRWETLAKGWAAIHPAAIYGVNAVLFYALRSMDELDYVRRAVNASYAYATGKI